jgi:hypothetical protein
MRWIAASVLFAFLYGCAGSGAHLTPNVEGFSHGSTIDGARHRITNVRLRLTIPRRVRGGRELSHPSTISSLTQSVRVAVNGGTGQVFNATPSSPGCTVVAGQTTCTFGVAAPAGNDTFVVRTYSAINGGGTILDQGTAVLKILAGQANSATITLGPVVTTTADSGVGSLRFAVGSANPGDTILFLLAAGSTIALNSPITLLSQLTIAGPGVTTSVRHHRVPAGKRDEVTYNGITISGNNAQQMFIVRDGGNATISGLILAHGSANPPASPGGAIGVFAGAVLSLVGDVLTGSTSTVQSAIKIHRRPHACAATFFRGGAIYNNGSLDVSNSTFDSNVVVSNPFPVGTNCQYGYGGAIFNDTFGTLAVTGSTFTNNSAYEGGAVYNQSTTAPATFNADTFTGNLGCTATTGCPALGCTNTGCNSYADGLGAAIFDSAGPGVVITNSTFTANVDGGATSGSQGDGGALYLLSGTPKVTGSTFNSNIAGGGTDSCSQGSGGAIYTEAALEIDNDTFTGNQAGGDRLGDGGAVYAVNSVSGSGDTFTSNASAVPASACSNGISVGGAISAGGTTSLNSSTFANNSASSQVLATGGAIYSTNATLAGDAFTGNTASVTGATANAAFGGAIFTIKNLTTTGNTFTSNAAIESTNANGYGEGGAMYCSALASNGDTFKSNTAGAVYETYGGAVDVDGAFTISGDTFTSNVSTSSISLGGAIFANAVGAVSNSTLSGNAAGSGAQLGYGGGVYDDMGSTITADTFSTNSATSAGGGLFNLTYDYVYNSTFSGNKVTAAPANYGGGGVYDAAGMTIFRSTISGNTVTVTGAQAGGGGIYDLKSLNLQNSTISGNAVLGNVAGAGGGGIFIADDAGVVNSTIIANTSSVDGGGIETYNTKTGNVWDSTLYQNTSTGNGGNIQNNPGYSITIGNSIVAGGSAANHPDLENLGTFTDLNYNIFQEAGIGILAHDLTADPKLLTLANNGGPTQTIADQASSPGTAYIPYTGGNKCGAISGVFTDQRGFSRGAGGTCDVGAYEFSGIATAVRTIEKPHHKRP